MSAIGIIGGTGVYDPSIFENIHEESLMTPYGEIDYVPVSYTHLDDYWTIMIKCFFNFFIYLTGVLDTHTFNPSCFSKFSEVWIYKVCSIV